MELPTHSLYHHYVTVGKNSINTQHPQFQILTRFLIVDNSVIYLFLFQYEYEAELEDSYRASLVKSFKKQVDDGYFDFIMVDCINNLTKHYEEMWSYAKQKGFEVSVFFLFTYIYIFLAVFTYLSIFIFYTTTIQSNLNDNLIIIQI